MRYTDIVVGIDGSGTSTSALRWAAAEARLHAARLRILTAYSSTWPPEAFGGLAELPEYVGQRFDEVVTEAVAEIRALQPGIEVTGEAIPGEPASTLLEAGRTAAMVVVGNRGLGRFASLLLGSVSQHVATHATTVPVVVVRGRADTTSGLIVVGVDDSPSAQRALELGFDEAQRRHCGLVAVTSYPVQISPHVVDMPPLPNHQDAVRRDAAHNLGAALTPWREKYPIVAVTALTEPGNLARNLVDMSSEAALLIVGSCGYRALVGTILGSVRLQLLHHADCPVMIAPAEQMA
jgi:nucleotide-binding universal stress UspA family protein